MNVKKLLIKSAGEGDIPLPDKKPVRCSGIAQGLSPGGAFTAAWSAVAAKAGVPERPSAFIVFAAHLAPGFPSLSKGAGHCLVINTEDFGSPGDYLIRPAVSIHLTPCLSQGIAQCLGLNAEGFGNPC